MPQSLSKVLVHLIFSTKHREPLIGVEIRPRLHAYLAGILDNLKSPSLQTGGVADHVHILLALGRTMSQADVVDRRVSPLQGLDGWFGPSSQGVALGCRVVAPLALNLIL